MKLESPSELPIDFAHFATLYCLDSDKNGLFHMDELIQYAHTWKQRRRVTLRHEFEAEIRGSNVLTVLRALRSEGVAHCVDWFTRVLCARHPPMHNPGTPHVQLFPSEAVEVLHHVFCDALVGAVPYRETVALLQQASEAKGLLDVADPTLDDFVAVSVVKEFLTGIFASFSSFLPSVTPLHAAPGLGDID